MALRIRVEIYHRKNDVRIDQLSNYVPDAIKIQIQLKNHNNNNNKNTYQNWPPMIFLPKYVQPFVQLFVCIGNLLKN